MISTRYRVCFHDEAPRIGSGWRIVVAQVGRKWVRLASAAGRAKLDKTVWATIARAGQELPPRKRRRKARS